MRRVLLFMSLFVIEYPAYTFAQVVIPKEEIQTINSKIRSISTTRSGYNSIIDGPIIIDKWYQTNTRENPSNYKIAFILKEAYGEDDVVDLTELRRKETSLKSMAPNEGRPTYQPMVTISNMLVKDIPYDQVEVLDPDAYTLFKECSAIIEVKKEYGTSQSSNSDIMYHAKKNYEIMKEQISIYDPNVIIICLNNLINDFIIREEFDGYYIFDEFFPKGNAGTLKLHPKFSYYYNDNRIYINTYHPSYAIRTHFEEEYCNEIVEIIQSWINQK